MKALLFCYLAMVVLVCGSLVSCGTNGVHGNVNAGVTGSVLDPTNAQFNAGGQINFAKRPPSGYAK